MVGRLVISHVLIAEDKDIVLSLCDGLERVLEARFVLPTMLCGLGHSKSNQLFAPIRMQEFQTKNELDGPCFERP